MSEQLLINRIVQLENENAKLRDVARKLFSFVKRTSSYPKRETFARQELSDELRELGVIDR